jgi:signal transduction histidine kinase
VSATVLFVDDEPAVLDGLRRALRGQPFEILCATSAAEGLRLLDAQPIEVVVSDQDMPEMLGTAFLAEVRLRHPETRRFVLTGKPALAVAVEAVNSGAITGFFTKPSAPEEIATAIRAALDDKARLDTEVTRLQKADVLGRLAGGVAHDISNLLSIISGRSQLLLSRGGDSDRARRDAEVIDRTSRQGALLARRFLKLLRQHGEMAAPVDLNAVVSGSQSLLRALLGPGIELTFELADGLEPVLACADQLDQVVLNLALNARDAMPGGGRLTLRTADAAGAALLQVRDTGTGMTPEVRARIFTPFFTTKSAELGTGLGLATVRLIVHQHGGKIEVDSAPGHGTTFTIRLPRADPFAAADSVAG